MVKTTAPLASSEASGSFRKILTFGKTKGRNFLKKKPSPRDPASPAQLSIRAMMRGLQAAWTPYADDFAPAWKPTPTSTRQEAYFSFLAYNLKRWSHGDFPTVDPTVLTEPFETTWNEPDSEAQIHAIHLTASPFTLGNNLAYAVHLTLDPLEGPTKKNLVKIEINYDSLDLDLTIETKKPGDLYFHVTNLDLTGAYGTYLSYPAIQVLE
jgi:hypothetical protein